MSEIAGMVLGGGKSRRMGRDKALLAFHDAHRAWTLGAWMVHRWCAHCEPLLWVGGQAPKAESGSLVTVVQDCPEYVGEGPLAGLYAGLRALVNQGPEWTLLLAVDMPGFAPKWVAQLARARRPGVQGLVFDVGPKASLFGALIEIAPAMQACGDLLAEGERRLQALPARLTMQGVPPPLDATAQSLRSSVNAPEDFARWLGAQGFAALEDSAPSPNFSTTRAE